MNQFALNWISGPTTEPVSVGKLKTQLRLDPDDSTENTYLSALVTAARQAIEQHIGKPIGLQVFELGLRCWPCRFIPLPRPPLVELWSVEYTDEDQVETALYNVSVDDLDDAVFTVDTAGEPGGLYLKSDQSWPDATLAYGYPIKIQYTSGIQTVPKAIEQAVLLLAAHYYENREAVTGTAMAPLPMAVDALCAPYVHHSFGVTFE